MCRLTAFDPFDVEICGLHGDEDRRLPRWEDDGAVEDDNNGMDEEHGDPCMALCSVGRRKRTLLVAAMMGMDIVFHGT